MVVRTVVHTSVVLVVGIPAGVHIHTVAVHSPVVVEDKVHLLEGWNSIVVLVVLVVLAVVSLHHTVVGELLNLFLLNIRIRRLK